MDAPLKAALTGLELLVARAQLWQTTAAKHVSLDSQLQAVTALAGRWRRLELASWRRLLERTVGAYAAGAGSCQLLPTGPWTLSDCSPCICNNAAQRIELPHVVTNLAQSIWRKSG